MDLSEKFNLVGNWHLSVALYSSVSNCAELKQLAMKGELNGALLTPSMIIEPFQLQAAAVRAIHSYTHQKLTTRTLHSELIYCLSPSKNISSSFQNFGINSGCHEVLIVVISDGVDDEISKICAKVSGDAVSLTHLPNFTAIDRIKKVYGVTDAELTSSTLLNAVVTRMATREFL
jgi:EKC/KEOPS complex subunit CGI121/TPRKB